MFFSVESRPTYPMLTVRSHFVRRAGVKIVVSTPRVITSVGLPVRCWSSTCQSPLGASTTRGIL